MAAGWTAESLLAHLGLPADYLPATEAEAWATWERVVDVFKDPGTKSGYKEVYKVGGKWQAKVYVAPGKQRNLGSFFDPRDAAERIIAYIIGSEPLPPSPKPRNKRGQGRQPRTRRTMATAAHKARVSAAEPSPMPVAMQQLHVEVAEPQPGDVLVQPESA